MTDRNRRYDCLVAHPELPKRELIVEQLRTDGFARVASVSSGKQTINRLRRQPWHAVICAVNLADIDCWRLIRMIRSGHFSTACLPVLIMTDTPPPSAIRTLAADLRSMLVSRGDLDRLQNLVASALESVAKPSVLIIEDDQPAGEAAAHVLDKSFQVEVQRDGKSGLEAWISRRHQLVLLDLKLPRMSGDRILRQIIAADADQPVLVLTAHATRQRLQALMLAGAAEVICKPFDIHSLPRVCERLVNHHALIAADRDATTATAIANQLYSRVRVADKSLDQGQPALASRHLKAAIASSFSVELSDDEWSQLLDEFR